MTLITALRDMLRQDFKLADNRDLAVAEAVRAWYMAQFPHLHIVIDQPDLAGIIAKVRPVSTFIEQDHLNAQRYLTLRNLPPEMMGVSGVPCIAVPNGPDHGNFVTEEDADKVVDLLIETMKGSEP